MVMYQCIYVFGIVINFTMLDEDTLYPLVLLFLMVLDREERPLRPLLIFIWFNYASIGCSFADVVINHLINADDLVAFTPSANDLQTLLDLGLTFGKNYDILFYGVYIFATIKCGKQRCKYFGR